MLRNKLAISEASDSGVMGAGKVGRGYPTSLCISFYHYQWYSLANTDVGGLMIY